MGVWEATCMGAWEAMGVGVWEAMGMGGNGYGMGGNGREFCNSDFHLSSEAYVSRLLPKSDERKLVNLPHVTERKLYTLPSNVSTATRSIGETVCLRRMCVEWMRMLSWKGSL